LTTTTRLSLTKPAGSDLVSIATLNANSDKIDAAIGATLVTSGTRPATPFDGQIIYETDTDHTYAYRAATTSWKAVDKVITPCTTVSRPFAPYTGQMIYEFDTNLTYVWLGAWYPVSNAIIATSTTRPTPLLGQVIYETDTHSMYISTTSGWRPVGKVPAISGVDRDALFPSPVLGDQVRSNSYGYVEQYYSTYASPSNEGGANPAGWYPAPGTEMVASITRNSTAVSVPSGSTITLKSGFDVARFQGLMTASGGTDPNIQVPFAGFYRVSANISWPSAAGSTYRYLFVSRNQTTDATPAGSNMVLAHVMQPAGTAVVINTVSQIVKLNANDVLRLVVNQNSGGSLTISDNSGPYGYNTGLSVEWVGVAH
jgi:hypothetical protein